MAGEQWNSVTRDMKKRIFFRGWYIRDEKKGQVDELRRIESAELLPRFEQGKRAFTWRNE